MTVIFQVYFCIWDFFELQDTMFVCSSTALLRYLNVTSFWNRSRANLCPPQPRLLPVLSSQWASAKCFLPLSNPDVIAQKSVSSIGVVIAADVFWEACPCVLLLLHGAKFLDSQFKELQISWNRVFRGFQKEIQNFQVLSIHVSYRKEVWFEYAAALTPGNPE